MPNRQSRLFSTVAAGSALVCIALMVLWVHSVKANDVLVEPGRAGDHWLMTSAFGTLTAEWQAPQRGSLRPGWVFIKSALPWNWPNGWRWFLFDAYQGRSRHFLFLRSAPVYGMSVPHWFLIGLTGALPVWWVHRILKSAERARFGLCRRCGYDLRATPQGGGDLLPQCPECGLASVAEPQMNGREYALLRK